MMKTNLLSAVVTLGLALPGTAVLAQDTATEEELLTTLAETPEAEAETAPAEAPAAEEAPAETDAPAAEPEVDAAPADEPAVEAAPAEDTATEEAPAAEAPVEDAPAEEATTEEAPAETAPAEEAPVAEEAPAEETATEDAATEEAPEEVSAEDAEEAPAEEVEATDEAQSTAEENAENEVIAEDDVAGQAHSDDPNVGVMEAEDHGEETAAEDHAGDDDQGDDSHAEVCAACHGLEYVAMRTLSDETGPNMPEEQVIEYAKGYDVYDAELDDTRPGTPVDHFPGSNLPNAPDLSLMAKKRAAFHGPYGLGINQFLKGIGGPEYITALLAGYTGEEKEQAGTVLYENTVFPGGWIAMAPPLSDELVEFADEHANDVQHMAEDVSAFLMWTAEPKLGARKQAGFAGVVLLGLLSVLLYLTNKKLWAPVKNRRKDD